MQHITFLSSNDLHVWEDTLCSYSPVSLRTSRDSFIASHITKASSHKKWKPWEAGASRVSVPWLSLEKLRNPALGCSRLLVSVAMTQMLLNQNCGCHTTAWDLHTICFLFPLPLSFQSSSFGCRLFKKKCFPVRFFDNVGRGQKSIQRGLKGGNQLFTGNIF